MMRKGPWASGLLSLLGALACSGTPSQPADSFTGDGVDATEAISDGVSDSPGKPCIEITPAGLAFAVDFALQCKRPMELHVTVRSCGTAPLKIFAVHLVPETAAYELDLGSISPRSVPTQESPVTLLPGEEIQVGVVFQPVEAPVVDETLVVTNDSEQSSVVVRIEGYTVNSGCPFPIIEIDESTSLAVGDTVHLQGGASCPASGTTKSYAWTVMRPPMDASMPVTISAEPEASDLLDREGTYRYCLDTCDADFCSSAPQCKTTACKDVVVAAAR